MHCIGHTCPLRITTVLQHALRRPHVSPQDHNCQLQSLVPNTLISHNCQFQSHSWPVASLSGSGTNTSTPYVHQLRCSACEPTKTIVGLTSIGMRPLWSELGPPSHNSFKQTVTATPIHFISSYSPHSRAFVCVPGKLLLSCTKLLLSWCRSCTTQALTALRQPVCRASCC
jgi:hypothetical protein